MATGSWSGSLCTLAITILFLVTLSAAAGTVPDPLDAFQPLPASRRSPRGGFMGLNLMCQAHRRNCPGGFRKRYSRLTTAQEPTSPQASRFPAELSPLSALLLPKTPAKMAAGEDEEDKKYAAVAAVRLSALLDRLRQRLMVISGQR